MYSLYENFKYMQGKDIFISYQWDIQEDVKRLYDLLTKKGYSCWMDINAKMCGGDNLIAHLSKAIKDCKVVVSLVTHKYAEAINCYREVSLGDERKKHIIPLIMENMKWPLEGNKGMDFLFTSKLYIDFKDFKNLSNAEFKRNPKFKELTDTLDDLLGRSPAHSTGQGHYQSRADQPLTSNVTGKFIRSLQTY